MAGIHSVQIRPLPLQAAVWDPEDEYQRGLVLGWLTTFFDSDAFWFEFGQAAGGLHLNFAFGHVYVPPGHTIVLDPETAVIQAFSPESMVDLFDYVRPIVDPGQPSLFDLGLPTVAVLGIGPDDLIVLHG